MVGILIFCALCMTSNLTHCSFATRVSQLKMYDIRERLLKGLQCYNFFVSATTTQLLSSGEFCKLRHDTIPVKSAFANISFYNNNSKISNFEL